jgi:membrane protein DedA with SNARE-associated domain
VGDAVLYGIGRSGMGVLPETWRRTIGADERRMTTLAEHYRQKGGRTLLLGKLTHSLGFAVLMAAGVARMPLRTFLGYNLMGTVPKTALFAAIGWSLGQAHASIDGWIGRASLALLVVATIALVAWFHHRKGDET